MTERELEREVAARMRVAGALQSWPAIMVRARKLIAYVRACPQQESAPAACAHGRTDPSMCPHCIGNAVGPIAAAEEIARRQALSRERLAKQESAEPESRSVMRRRALARGEEMPDFSTPASTAEVCGARATSGTGGPCTLPRGHEDWHQNDSEYVWMGCENIGRTPPKQGGGG